MSLLQSNLDDVPLNEAPAKPTQIGHQIYGVELGELEKDEQHTAIPRFVVECVKVIESPENLTTNGIYRASGKKESIDKLKKKVQYFLFFVFQ